MMVVDRIFLFLLPLEVVQALGHQWDIFYSELTRKSESLIV